MCSRDYILVRFPGDILASFVLTKKKLKPTEADSRPPYFKTTEIFKMEPRFQMVALMFARFANQSCQVTTEMRITGTRKTIRDIPNPSFIGCWISGEPMARERLIHNIKKLYKIIIQKEVPVIQSKDVDFNSFFS